MPAKYNAFNDTRSADLAWPAYVLWDSGETAQDIARALCLTVPTVYKAVALVVRSKSAFRNRYMAALRKGRVSFEIEEGKR